MSVCPPEPDVEGVAVGVGVGVSVGALVATLGVGDGAVEAVLLLPQPVRANKLRVSSVAVARAMSLRCIWGFSPLSSSLRSRA